MKQGLRLTGIALGLMAFMNGGEAAPAQKGAPKPIHPNFKINAPSAILIDTQTGDVLYDRNSTKKIEPASTTKIMTAYLAFEALKDGRIQLDTKFKVSKAAWSKKGSSMFLNIGQTPMVEELLAGIITLSGNDACIVLAEGLSGSEEAFAAEMTERAHAIGAKDTTFKNSNGWPDEEHLTTARDLAIMAWRTVVEYPELYQKYYSMKEYSYNNIKQPNRNPLLHSGIVEADGLKTGFTDKAGFCLVGSAVEKGRRLIVVTTGNMSSKDRAKDSENLMAWGFREFQNFDLFKAGQVVEQAPVWFGKSSTVGMMVPRDVVVTMPRVSKRSLKVEAVYTSPIQAPIQKGQQIGTLVISSPKTLPKEFPLVATEDVGSAGFIRNIISSITYLLKGVS